MFKALSEKLPEPVRWILNVLLFLVYWLGSAFIVDYGISMYEYSNEAPVDIILRNAILTVPFLTALIAVVFFRKKVLL